MPENLISSEVIQMLVSSMTHQGSQSLREIEVERFLNALARAQSGVPTGIVSNDDPHRNDAHTK